MDIVSLLFYPSWLNAARDESRVTPDADGEDRRHCANDGAPDWRRVLAPFAAMVVLVLARAVLSAGA